MPSDFWSKPDAKLEVDRRGRVVPGFKLVVGTRGKVVSVSPSWLDCSAAADDAVGTFPKAVFRGDLVSKPFDSDALGFPPTSLEMRVDLSDCTEDREELPSRDVL